jgi:hypothetical protein
MVSKEIQAAARKAMLEEAHASSAAELDAAWRSWLGSAEGLHDALVPFSDVFAHLVTAEREMLTDPKFGCNSNAHRQGSAYLVQPWHAGDPVADFTGSINVKEGLIIYDLTYQPDESQPERLSLDVANWNWAIYKGDGRGGYQSVASGQIPRK